MVSQERKVFTYPDLTWQFAQYLKMEFENRNMDVALYLFDSQISINGNFMGLF